MTEIPILFSFKIVIYILFNLKQEKKKESFLSGFLIKNINIFECTYKYRVLYFRKLMSRFNPNKSTISFILVKQI